MNNVTEAWTQFSLEFVQAGALLGIGITLVLIALQHQRKIRQETNKLKEKLRSQKKK